MSAKGKEKPSFLSLSADLFHHTWGGEEEGHLSGCGKEGKQLSTEFSTHGVQGGSGDGQKAQDRHLKAVWGENDEGTC